MADGGMPVCSPPGEPVRVTPEERPLITDDDRSCVGPRRLVGIEPCAFSDGHNAAFLDPTRSTSAALYGSRADTGEGEHAKSVSCFENHL
jgi:hypothetical protein